MNQATANRAIRDFIKLGLVKEEPIIAEKGIRPREGRYYKAAKNQLVSELKLHAELICIIIGKVNPLRSTKS